MANMNTLNEQNGALLDNVTRQVSAMEQLSAQSARAAAEATSAMASAAESARTAQVPPIRHEITDISELTARMDQIITLMEKEQKEKTSRRGLFR